MKIAVVGHGPSMKDSNLGEQIDSYEKVVRLKGSQEVLWTQDYGCKCDALCSSTEVMGTFFKTDAEECWAYPKYGDFNRKVAMQAIEKLQKPVMIPLNHVNHWNQRYRQLGGTHPNVSTGMGAIIIACLRYAPDEIALFGFDNLQNPELKFDRVKEIPRTGAGPYPGHDFNTEKKLIPVLEATYNLRIYHVPDSQSRV